MDSPRQTFRDPSEIEVRSLEEPRARRGQTLFDPDGALQLHSLVKSLGPNLKEQVSRAFRQWNLIVRDHMRNEMGLRLTVGDERQGVPVYVEDGMPAPLYDLMVGTTDPFLWFLAANRHLIANAQTGLQFVLEHLPPTRFGQGQVPGEPTDGDVERTAFYLGELNEKSGETKVEEMLQSIDQDVLGGYFFRQPAVCLYWAPIGIFARLLQVPVEALTLVVLSHEVAHAYSHLGRDIDGTRWETGAFAQADLNIVEGLAQFYTGIVTARLRDRFPAAHEAYEKLLALQRGAYKAHVSWIPEGTTQGGEVIRSALVICRSSGMVDYRQFCRLLGDSLKRIATKQPER